MACVPPSPCFLLPGPDLRHRLFPPNMLRNVGRLHDIHQWYLPAHPCRTSLTSSPTVTFDKSSQGQLAAVIYEWSDVNYLGKTTSYIEDLPVSVGAGYAAADFDNIRTSRRRTSAQQMHSVPATVTSPSSAGSSWTYHRPYLSTRPASGLRVSVSAQEIAPLPAAVPRMRRRPPVGCGMTPTEIPLLHRTRMPHPGGEPTQIH